MMPESTMERSIMAKLFLAERATRGRPASETFDRFMASLNPSEARHPIAAWIARKRDSLDWNENVCDMVSRYFNLPLKPLWPGERGNGYDEAAEALERSITQARADGR